MIHIAGPVRDFVLTQPSDSQQEILQALREIEDTPLVGEYLPFPWQSRNLGYSTAQYFITYRLTDDVLEVLGIVKMPTDDDIQRAIEQRL